MPATSSSTTFIRARLLRLYMLALALALPSLTVGACADDGKEAALEALPGFGKVPLPGRVADEQRVRSLGGAGASHFYRLTGTGLDPAGTREWFASHLEPLGWLPEGPSAAAQLRASDGGRYLAGIWRHGDAFWRVEWEGGGLFIRGRTLHGPVVSVVISNAPMNPTLHPVPGASQSEVSEASGSPS